MLEKEDYHFNCLQFIRGVFDAEGCVKIIKEKIRKTPKICLDITNTNKEILDIIQELLQKELSIESGIPYKKQTASKIRKLLIT